MESPDILANIALNSLPNKKEIIDQVNRLTSLAMEGKKPFPEVLDERLKLIKPTREHIEKLILELKSKITPSVVRNKAFFQNYKDNIYIISGGFREFIVPVVRDFGIEEDHVIANDFIFDKNNNVTGFNKKNPLAGKGGKTEVIRKLKLKGDVIIVGDGFTDYEVKKNKAAHKFFAFIENVNRASVVSQADDVFFNFDELIFMFNVPRETVVQKSEIKILMQGIENPAAIEEFQRKGFQIETLPHTPTEEEIMKKIKDINILTVDSRTKINKKVIESGKSLMAIGRFGLGTANIDTNFAAQKGIPVFNAPFANIQSVAELIIGEIIILSRRLFDKSNLLHKGTWEKTFNNSREIRGKKLGIIGYDNVGSHVGMLAENLGMEVYFYDVDEKLPQGKATQCNSLEELLLLSDVISLHLDASAQNQNILSEEKFKLMKEGIIIINLSRGCIINEKILLKYIKNNKVKGAAIDVFANEPGENKKNFTSLLQNLPNVILTPHIGGSTEEAATESGHFVSQKLINFLETGTTKLSVNFPELQLPENSNNHRFIHVHKNIPGMLATINSLLAKNKINIEGQYLKTNADIGYVATDIATFPDKNLLNELEKIPGTIKIRNVC